MDTQRMINSIISTDCTFLHYFKVLFMKTEEAKVQHYSFSQVDNKNKSLKYI